MRRHWHPRGRGPRPTRSRDGSPRCSPTASRLREGGAIRRGGPATGSPGKGPAPGTARRSAGSCGIGGWRSGSRPAMATPGPAGRRGPCGTPAATSSPQSRAGAPGPRCSRPRPAIEVAALRGDGVREGGVLLRGPRRGPRARRQGAARDGARRRDRGRSDALREGDRVAAVLAAEGALPPRVEVPRPPLGKREGVRRVYLAYRHNSSSNSAFSWPIIP